MPKSMLEILDETVAFYNSKNRSVVQREEDVICLYKGPDGKKCAFSRCCTEEAADSLVEDNSADYFERGGSLDYLLQEEYQGHPTAFWMKIQQLHDLPVNWDDSGLSILGMGTYKGIKEWVEKSLITKN